MATKKPSRTDLISEIKRIAAQFPGVKIGRDQFRAHSPYRDAYGMYWPNFAAFAAEAGVKQAKPPKEPKPPKPPAEPKPALTPAQTLEINKEKIKAKQSGVEDQLKVATERIVQLEQEIQTVLSIGEKTPQLTIIVPKVPSGTSESVAVMVASDWHVEESVDPATVNYKNEFSLEIADARILKYFQGSFRLFDILRAHSAIKTVVVALLGDFITNTIHEDFQESNNLLPAEAIYWAECRLVSGLRFLLENSPHDTEFLVVCHSGNHGRMTKKQRGTTEAGNSLEHYMYYHIRDFFKGEPRMRFQIAEGYHSFVRLFDERYTIRFHHGHAINYNGGVGGITIPVNKAIAQWNQADKDVDLDVFGHFHQYLDAGNFVSNGSLIGRNDFAIRIKAGYEPPQQAFFTVAKKWLSKTMTTPIFLS